jgi:hypothetical protein
MLWEVLIESSCTGQPWPCLPKQSCPPRAAQAGHVWPDARAHVGQLGRRWCFAIVAACLASSACESAVVIGSGCKDGVCPQVSGVDNCLVRTTERAIMVGDATAGRIGDTGPLLGTVCLPTALPRDAQRLVDLRVHWVLPLAADALPGTPAHCDERSYLHHIDGAFAAEYRVRFPDHEVCDVDQVPVPAGADSTTIPTGTGFYYDDFSQDFLTSCAGRFPARTAFNDMYVPEGVLLRVISDEVLDTNGKPDTERVCRAGGDGSQLGKRCLPPLESYDSSQTVLETRSAACGGDPCLAYHLEGSVDPKCVEKLGDEPVACADAAERAKLAFCSCRCAAPEPDAELCRCAKGFACEPLVHEGDPAVVGSYCVRNEIRTAP